MVRVRIRYDDGSGYTPALVIDDAKKAEVAWDGDAFRSHIDDVRHISANELRRALLLAADDLGSPQNFSVSEVDRQWFDPDDSPFSVSFGLEDTSLSVHVDFLLDDFSDEAETALALQDLVSPLLQRHRATTRSIEMNGYSSSPPWIWNITFLPRIRARTIGELYQLGHQVEMLLKAATAGQLTRETTLELIRAGRVEVLIGQREGPWLDVKRQDYDLSSEAGKISLAQDVARFANAEQGGIVLVGMAAKKIHGEEVISEVRPIPKNPQGVRRHRQAIDTRLFPPVDDLSVKQIDLDDNAAIIAVHIPPQSEELKPFLVHGAIVDGKIQGSFSSIVRRRGEASIPVSPTAIHAALAAGRNLLRYGTRPK